MSSRVHIPKSKLAHHCDLGGKKFRYRDKREALNYLHRIQNHRANAERQGVGTGHLEKRAYKCGACKGWHLTKQD